MKKIEEMTKEEILNLDNETLGRMIDYRCAEEGIPLLTPPVKPQELDIEGMKDATVYELANLNFKDRGRAEDIQKVIEGCELLNTSYCQGPGYNLRLTTYKPDPPKVSTRKVFTEVKWESVKQQIAKYNKDMKEYEADKKTYDNAMSSRKEIRDEIIAVYNEVQHEKYMTDKYVGEFNKYLELADNNAEIALRFLLKAYPEIEEKYPDVLTIINSNGQE